MKCRVPGAPGGLTGRQTQWVPCSRPATKGSKVRLGDVANEGAAHYGKPLDGVRVLAAEQMQALPYATQLLARLGADVVKVEPPTGESGRGSQPSMLDPDGRFVGATFLRNNLGKRSITVNLKAGSRPRPVPRPRAALRRGRRELQGRHDGPPRPRLRRRRRGAPVGDLRVGVGFRCQRIAVRVLAGVRVDRRGDVGHLRVPDPPATSRRARTRSARSATSAPASSPPSASSPRCVIATRPARASRSTSRCSTPPWR